MCVCWSVASQKSRLSVDWKVSVKKVITNVGAPLDVFGFLSFQLPFAFKFISFFWLCANKSTVHIGELAVAVSVSDR